MNLIARTTTTLLLNWIIIIDLNLNTTPGDKFRDNNFVCDLLEYNRICLSSQTIVVRM